VFIVLGGAMDIEFRDGVAHLAAGEMFVVLKGSEHRTPLPANARLCWLNRAAWSTPARPAAISLCERRMGIARSYVCSPDHKLVKRGLLGDDAAWEGDCHSAWDMQMSQTVCDLRPI